MADLGANEEIQAALKEFEDRELSEQAAKAARTVQIPRTSKMAQLLVKYSKGAVRDERQANIILVSVAALMIFSAFIVLFVGYRERSGGEYITPEEMDLLMSAQ